MNAAEPVREKWIDHAKAIAMILIILGHVSGGLSGWFNFKFVYGFHLVVFFMLSGYTVKVRPVDLSFVRKKFNRLMTPYFITCFAVLFMDVFNALFVFKERSIAQVTGIIAADLKRSFFASGSIDTFGQIEIGTRFGAIWFLPALFFAILIFQLLVNVVKNNRILGLITAAITIIGYLTGQFIWLPFSIQSGMFAVFSLWAGYSLKKYAILEKVKWYFFIPALAIVLVGIHEGYCSVLYVTAYVRDLILSPLVGFSGALLVYLVAKWSAKIKLLDWIGQNSLYILCVHLVSLETLGAYYQKVLRIFGIEGQPGTWAVIIMELIFALFGTWLLLLIKEKLYGAFKKKVTERNVGRMDDRQRDPVVDITRGIFILSMLVGHFNIDSTLRGVIYSCHMIAFVFLSGYCYKKTEHFWKTVLHMVRTFLLPYAVCCVVHILLDLPQWSGVYFGNILKTYVLGMSFSERLLTNVDSVGPVYFILMLFVVRIIYMIIDKAVRRDSIKWVLILFCTAAGILLGNRGFWLPWSIDAALYSMIFYQIGITCKKYRALTFVTENPWLYFLLSSIWVFMIYKGGMELAVRNYGIYGLVIFGAVSGTVLVYSLSAYLGNTTILVSKALKWIGQASLILLIVHRLLNGRLGDLLGRVVSKDGFAWLLLCIIVQVVLAVLIQLLITWIKRTHKKNRNKQVNSI